MTDSMAPRFEPLVIYTAYCAYPVMDKLRLQIHRTECDTATDLGYMREDGVYAAVRIFDWSDTATIAGQLRVLAEQIRRPPQTFTTASIEEGTEINQALRSAAFDL